MFDNICLVIKNVKGYVKGFYHPLPAGIKDWVKKYKKI